MYPVILTNSNTYVWVRVEDNHLYKTESPKEALVCWALTFDLFNLSHPDELINLYTKFM